MCLNGVASVCLDYFGLEVYLHVKIRRFVCRDYGRSESEVRSFLTQLVGREKVKVVCMDMSGPYRAMIRKWFPNAKIVSGRFHAVRIVMHHFLDLARELVPQLKNKGGYLIALRKRPENLDVSSKKTAFTALQRLSRL